MAEYRRRQLVRHVRTGGVYRIVHTPAVCVIEAMSTPAYAYRLADKGVAAPLWVRPQAEMEDGRFEAVEGPA